ncbi:hypothetical protein FGM00_08060 [Aggregatimonas sangjinii]|uniref:3D (Asp-Asp-Asp) domain-containing protein n=1 Tax=Aggregatimonas sangjinii TaxID=2583587 RepID=A0A5B7SSS6_9FLAO|nr:3D domain-containing protein [Aggregatimonas sangjinii]QCX00058.1 hypothetical protein FGM00_08060 [Aggregatimonas sangjinii]
MKKSIVLISYLVILVSTYFLGACTEDKYEWKSLPVKVSAYNSVSWQTDGKPNLAAWGDTLKPGMKCIAVSRDLIGLGLDHNTQVKIEGFDGIYLVKDKMNSRYTNKIDIFMGKDVEKAREWGNQELTIQYRVEKSVDEKKSK